MPCGLPNRTFRKVLEYSAESTRVLCAEYGNDVRTTLWGIGQGRLHSCSLPSAHRPFHEDMPSQVFFPLHACLPDGRRGIGNVPAA